jgi:hypothetical protein
MRDEEDLFWWQQTAKHQLSQKGERTAPQIQFGME